MLLLDDSSAGIMLMNESLHKAFPELNARLRAKMTQIDRDKERASSKKSFLFEKRVQTQKFLILVHELRHKKPFPYLKVSSY
jgi:hypothetical protein